MSSATSTASGRRDCFCGAVGRSRSSDAHVTWLNVIYTCLHMHVDLNIYIYIISIMLNSK